MQIEKDEVLKLFEKVKMLESNLEILQSTTQVKLDEERNNYHSALNRFVEQFKQEIHFNNNKFADLAMTKIKQERENQYIFECL